MGGGRWGSGGGLAGNQKDPLPPLWAARPNSLRPSRPPIPFDTPL